MKPSKNWVISVFGGVINGYIIVYVVKNLIKEDLIMSIYGKWADLNGDGEVDDFEKFVELEEMDRMDRFISGDDSDDMDEEEELEYEMELAGLDPIELSWMDDEERREAIEEAGLDLDDFDF